MKTKKNPFVNIILIASELDPHTHADIPTVQYVIEPLCSAFNITF